MSDERLKKYQDAQRARKEAQSWNALPDGVKYSQSTTFEISAAHCKAPVLCRAGQQRQGAKNYWETERDFNSAILEHVIDNWNEIYPKVLFILQNRENKALIECQSFIDEMQEAINSQ